MWKISGIPPSNTKRSKKKYLKGDTFQRPIIAAICSSNFECVHLNTNGRFFFATSAARTKVLACFCEGLGIWFLNGVHGPMIKASRWNIILRKTSYASPSPATLDMGTPKKSGFQTKLLNSRTNSSSVMALANVKLYCFTYLHIRSRLDEPRSFLDKSGMVNVKLWKNRSQLCSHLPKEA